MTLLDLSDLRASLEEKDSATMEVDVRGLNCPLPVIKTKNALDALQDGELTVIIERRDGCENVMRFAAGRGCESRVEERDGLFHVTIRKEQPPREDEHAASPAPAPDAVAASAFGRAAAERVPAATPTTPASTAQKGPVIILITSTRLGSGSDELGTVLMKAFLNTLGEAESRPAQILFLNEGVGLTTEGSEVLDTLCQLERSGVGICSCGTCLDYYQLKDKLRVGVVTNMYDTVNTLLAAANVIKI